MITAKATSRFPSTASSRVHCTARPSVTVRCAPRDASSQPDNAQPVQTVNKVSAPPSATSAATTSNEGRKKRVRQADTTDAVASFLTRRFGLAGGLAWLGFLAIGTLGEQIKTRWEVASEEQGTRDVADAQEVALPSGVRYTDLRVGGGQQPYKGCLVVVDYIGKADGVVFEDTEQRGKPIVYFFGSRPFTGGMCEGTEEALKSMRAGGKRRVIVPAPLGFGEKGAVLRGTEHVPDKQGIIPPNAQLEYELELVRVSIPPS